MPHSPDSEITIMFGAPLGGRRRFRTLEGRARWLFDFLRQDLARPSEQESLGLYGDVGAFLNQGLNQALVYRGTLSRDFVTTGGPPGWPEVPFSVKPTRLRQLQRDTQAAIDSLEANGVCSLPKAPSAWRLEKSGTLMSVRFSGDLRAQFGATMLLTLAGVWPTVKRCRECRALFLPPRRGFCSDRCSQAYRWKKFEPTRERDYRQEYLDRVKKKYPAAVHRKARKKQGRRG